MAPNDVDIYDWNIHDGRRKLPKSIQLDDESLRDGLQSPSTVDPPTEGKLKLIRLMVKLGINAADIGYPRTSKKMHNDVLKIAQMIKDEKLKIYPNCAARTLEADIRPVIDISHEVGIPIEVAAFIGSSPIRQFVENWDLDHLLKLTENAVNLCIENDVPVMFVTEDTTRARPDDLSKLYLRAVEQGAKAICLSDTVGHSTPEGAYSLVSYMKNVLKDNGYKAIRIDWHGHRDRGLSLANAFAAIEAGAHRIHGSALGIGERCGNVPMDQLLVNLKLYGVIDNDLCALAEYTETVSEMVKMPIPANYPVIGRDAFRTATGVHAAAIIKAKQYGRRFTDTIYSSVPASLFGKDQVIDIGPLSGISNVRYKLEQMGLTVSDEILLDLLDHAKELGRLLNDEEIARFIAYHAH
jgi:2-isopropylmalate synthase